jgi:hypothetical protein
MRIVVRAQHFVDHFIECKDKLPCTGVGARHIAAVAVFAASLSLLGSEGLAVTCGTGGPGTSSEGSETELAQRIQEETIEKAKASAGLASIPIFAGVSISQSHLDQDGFTLKTPVVMGINNCTHVTITKFPSFETNTTSASALSEFDLRSLFGLPRGYVVKVGAAVSGKALETRTSDTIIGIANGGPSHLREDGVQLDLYSLLAVGSSYLLVAGSIGGGTSELFNSSFDAGFPQGQARIGQGTTDYDDHSVSVTLGHVFTLYSTPASRTLLDVSGGLLWSNYTRDGFTDTRGAVFSDAKTDEFSGKAEVKLAYQLQEGLDVFTPYVKGGVKHRFDYDNSFSVVKDPNFTFSGPFVLTSDNTFWRAGGGLGFSFKNGDITGVIDGTYQGSGDSREVIGKAQLIFKLN